MNDVIIDFADLDAPRQVSVDPATSGYRFRAGKLEPAHTATGRWTNAPAPEPTPPATPRRVTDKGYHKGRVAPNKGKTYPPTPPTVREALAVIDAFDRETVTGRRNRALVILLWRCGPRISEALALRPVDVDLEEGTLTILRGKGGKRRVIGVDLKTRDELAAWMTEREQLGAQPHQPIFCGVHRQSLGRPMYPATVRVALKAAAAKAGVNKRLTPHQWRHGCACDMARDDTPIHLVQRTLGHADLGMTARGTWPGSRGPRSSRTWRSANGPLRPVHPFTGKQAEETTVPDPVAIWAGQIERGGKVAALDIAAENGVEAVIDAMYALAHNKLCTVGERVMTFGGIQRTPRGEFWISRDDVIRLVDELLNLPSGRGVETGRQAGTPRPVDTINKSARRVATDVPGLGRECGRAGGESGIRPARGEGDR